MKKRIIKLELIKAFLYLVIALHVVFYASGIDIYAAEVRAGISESNGWANSPITVTNNHILTYIYGDRNYMITGDADVLAKLGIDLSAGITVIPSLEEDNTYKDATTLSGVIDPIIKKLTVYPIPDGKIDLSNIGDNVIYKFKNEDAYSMQYRVYDYYEWTVDDGIYTKTDNKCRVIRISEFTEIERINYYFHINDSTIDEDFGDMEDGQVVSLSRKPSMLNYTFVGFKAQKTGSEEKSAKTLTIGAKDRVTFNPADFSDFIEVNPTTNTKQIHFYPEYEENFHFLLNRTNPITGLKDGYNDSKYYLNAGGGWTVPNKNYEGYVCKGWTDGTTVWPVNTVLRQSDFPDQNEVALTAVYERQIIYRFYDGNNQKIEEVAFNPDNQGSETVIIPDVASSREDREFQGWYAKLDGKDDSAVIEKTRNYTYTIGYYSYRGYLDSENAINFYPVFMDRLKVTIGYLVPGVPNLTSTYYSKWEDFTLPTPDETEGYRFLGWKDVTNGAGAENPIYEAGATFNRTTDFGNKASLIINGQWEQVTETLINGFGRIYVNPRFCRFGRTTKFTVDTDPTVYNVQTFYAPSVGYYTFTEK